MSVRVAGIVLAVLLAGASSATAAPDRRPPTKPGNFRVVAKTQTTVTLAWNASTDNSGSVSYDVRMWAEGRYVTVATLPRSQTTYTVTGLIPNVQYFFHVEAVDPSGNRTFSDGAYTTTLPDRTPPPAPAGLEVTRVTASQVSLTWDAPPDDTGIRAYQIGVTRSSIWNLIWTGPTSVTVVGLAPATAHSFTVRAQDLGYNLSPITAPAFATTAVTTDVTPPSAPANLRVSDRGCPAEVRLTWTQSIDDQDPQAAIRYQVFINGAQDAASGTPIGVGALPTYGVDGENVFVLRAVDSAGNVSAPSNEFRITLDDCM
jgi:chitodextrinase